MSAPASAVPEPAHQPAGGSTGVPAGSPPQSGWTAGRIISLVIGCLLALVSVGMILAAGGLLVADRTLRDDGYLTSDTQQLTSAGYAIVSDPIDLKIEGTDWPVIRRSVGDVRLRATPYSADSPLFLGIGPAEDVARYLQDVAHTAVTDVGDNPRTTDHTGAAPGSAPTEQDFWATHTTGRGPQELTWSSTSGRWRLVAMNADGSRNLTLLADVGATIPALSWIVLGLAGIGVLLLIPAVPLIVIPLRRVSR